MVKDGDVKLNCRQCGKQFVFSKGEQEFYEQKGFSFPSRCQECRTNKQSQLQHIVCAQCGTEIEKEASVFCTACLASVRLDCELKAKQSQRAASAAHTKLLAGESQKAKLEESLRQKEQRIADLELRVNSLRQDLDKAHQFYAALGPLQPTLDDIKKRLEALEYAQNKISDRMLQLAEKMHEMYENTGLLEIIKRSLRHYQRQNT